MFATYVIKIEQSMLCMTGVYFKDITNIIFIILHLNVSHLRAFSFLFCCHILGDVALSLSLSLNVRERNRVYVTERE